MLKINFKKLFLFIFFLTASLHAVEQIRLTTYYPAPFGDFENIRSNNMQVLNVIYGATRDGLNLTLANAAPANLAPVNVFQSLRVVGQFTMPFGPTSPAAVTDYSDLQSQKLLFAGAGGVFGTDARTGVLFDPVGHDALVRAQGSIYLQPSCDGAVDQFSYAAPTTSATPGMVQINGHLVVWDGDLKVTDDKGVVILHVVKNNPYENTGRPAVFINGDLYLNGDLKTAAGRPLTIDNLRVRKQLYIASDEEDALFRGFGASVASNNTILASIKALGRAQASSILAFNLDAPAIRSLTDRLEFRVADNNAIARMWRRSSPSEFYGMALSGEVDADRRRAYV